MLIGKNAPNFNTIAIMPNGQVENDFNYWEFAKDRLSVLFFFSMAFSYICPTELLALRNRFAEFKKRDIPVCVISCDHQLSLQRWTQLPIESGGVGQLPFPVLADPARRISEAYDVLVNGSLSLRATFMIDKAGVIRAQLITDFHIGRNVDEIIRITDAHQEYEKTGELIPANWNIGAPTLTGDLKNLIKFLKSRAETI